VYQHLERARIVGRNLLEIIVVGQLFPSHDAPVPSEESHTRLAGNSPLFHSAVGFAGMVDEARNGATGGIDNHILVEVHEIIALRIC